MARLRGDNVVNAIRTGITNLAAMAGKGYKYNASELSRLTGISRPTLQKYSEVVDDVLKEIAANHRKIKGQIVTEQLRDKIARIEEENALLKRELETLRRHHANIYSKLYNRMQSIAPLVKSELALEAVEDGRCIFCNQEVDETTFTERKKVVNFSSRRKAR